MTNHNGTTIYLSADDYKHVKPVVTRFAWVRVIRDDYTWVECADEIEGSRLLADVHSTLDYARHGEDRS